MYLVTTTSGSILHKPKAIMCCLVKKKSWLLFQLMVTSMKVVLDKLVKNNNEILQYYDKNNDIALIMH